MNAEPFVIERSYNAPINRVWKAITDKDAMKQWYFDIAEFKPEVGFEFGFEGKDNDGYVYVHQCRITEVILQNKLQYTWEYPGHEGSTLVTIELFPEGDKTRLRLTHEGIETLPNLPAFAKENFVKGWTAIIGTSLLEFVEEETIHKSIEVDATPEKAWEVFVNEDNIRHWGAAFSEGTFAKSDFKLGSEMTWYYGEDVVAKGIIVELSEPEMLDVAYYDDVAATNSDHLGRYHERYGIKEENGKTVIFIESGPLPLKYIKMHEPMWPKALQLMKEVAER